MPAGRPSLYTEATIGETIKYMENYAKEGDAIPSIAGLAVYLKVSRQSIYEWSNDPNKKEFSYILAQLLANQEKILMNNGLTGEFNAAITKLALGKHGYRDQIRQENTGKDGGPIENKTTYVIQIADPLRKDAANDAHASSPAKTITPDTDSEAI